MVVVSLCFPNIFERVFGVCWLVVLLVVFECCLVRGNITCGCLLIHFLKDKIDDALALCISSMINLLPAAGRACVMTKWGLNATERHKNHDLAADRVCVHNTPYTTSRFDCPDQINHLTGVRQSEINVPLRASAPVSLKGARWT